MDWNKFVKESEKYGYKLHPHILGGYAVWKSVIKGKYTNGEDIISFSPMFTIDGRVRFSDTTYKENVSYEKMLKIINAIEREE